MRACPFCGSGEQRTIPVKDSWTEKEQYRVVCETCDAMGTAADDPKQAKRFWDGILAKSDSAFKRFIGEMEGGVSSPMSTLTNTPGTGTAQPASQAAMTGAQQTADSAKGSGDRWDSSIGKTHTQATNESFRSKEFKGMRGWVDDWAAEHKNEAKFYTHTRENGKKISGFLMDVYPHDYDTEPDVENPYNGQPYSQPVELFLIPLFKEGMFKIVDLNKGTILKDKMQVQNEDDWEDLGFMVGGWTKHTLSTKKNFFVRLKDEIKDDFGMANEEVNESKRPDFKSMEELKKYYDDKLDALPRKIPVPGGGNAYSSGSKEGKYNRRIDTRFQNIINDRDIAIRKFKKLHENNLNPYDKIGAMMAKKLGVEQPFKQGDSRTNTIKQRDWEELDEDQEKDPESIDDYVKDPDKVFRNAKKRKVGKTNEGRFELETLDSYLKASKHVPDHPLTLVKKEMIKEEDLRTEEATKDIKAKETLEHLGIAFEYKPAKSGKNRVFIKEPMKKVLETLKEGGWEEYGKNPENTIRKYMKGDQILTIFAEGKDLPRATVTPKDQEEAKEHLVIRKVVPGSINPYLKS